MASVLGVTPTGYALVVSADRSGTLEELRDQPVAVVFGAGLDIRGEPMPFLRARLDLARQLYTAGKGRVVLVSGDNPRADYNEPDALRGYTVSYTHLTLPTSDQGKISGVAESLKKKTQSRLQIINT